MTAKQFYDWQTGGGTNDVMRLVDCLERADNRVVCDWWRGGESLGGRADGDAGCRDCHRDRGR